MRPLDKLMFAPLLVFYLHVYVCVRVQVCREINIHANTNMLNRGYNDALLMTRQLVAKLVALRV